MGSKGFQRESSLERSRYINAAYMDEIQLLTYANQLQIILKTINKYCNIDLNILEIGIGNGYIANALKTYDFNINTFDINKNLNPDYFGNILELNECIGKKKFQLALCCEVLEHMEFDYFEKALIELKEASEFTIITLPSFKRHYGFYGLLKFPRKILHINFGLEIGFKKLPEEHFWEIGSEKYSSRKKIEQVIKKHFIILEQGKFTLNNYHNYYILKRGK